MRIQAAGIVGQPPRGVRTERPALVASVDRLSAVEAARGSKDRRLAAWRRSLVSSGLAYATVENYTSAVRRYFDWAIAVGAEELGEPDLIEQWFRSLTKGSVGTSRTYWTAMRAFWRWASESGWATSDPMTVVPRPSAPAPSIEDLLRTHRTVTTQGMAVGA